MTTTRLCSGAETLIQKMHLLPEEEEKVRYTVQKYARPQSCCKLVCWIIYRIVQAVKSLFGCSDWQAARKVMENRWKWIAVERGVVQQNPQNAVEHTLIDRGLNPFFSGVSSRFLEQAVLTQEKIASFSNEELQSWQNSEDWQKWQSALEKSDIMLYIDRFKIRADDIRARRQLQVAPAV